MAAIIILIVLLFLGGLLFTEVAEVFNAWFDSRHP